MGCKKQTACLQEGQRIADWMPCGHLLGGLIGTEGKYSKTFFNKVRVFLSRGGLFGNKEGLLEEYGAL